MAVDWILGVGFRRGITWGQRVAATRPDLWPLPWPPYTGRAAVIAARYVAELTHETELLTQAAHACHEAAAQWWASGCCVAQDSARSHIAACRRTAERMERALPDRRARVEAGVGVG